MIGEVFIEYYALNLDQVLNFEVEVINIDDALEVFVYENFTAILSQQVELSSEASKMAEELGVKLALPIFIFKGIMLRISALPFLYNWDELLKSSTNTKVDLRNNCSPNIVV